MRNTMRAVIFALVLSLTPTLVWADNASDVQALTNEKALLDAKAARDSSEALAIKAASDLAKAKADAEAALIKSQIGAQTAQIDALKSTFGSPPTVGTDGNVTISDASTGMLLQVKAGSLQVTWSLAEKLCKTLTAAGVKDAFIAPSDLDTKIQSARMVLREFNALSEKVRLPANKNLVGLGGVKAAVGPAAILGAVSLLEYGAGALQSIAKLFRSDYAVGLSSDTTRASWLEYFMVAQCPAQIRAQLEAVVRNRSLDDVLTKLNDMLEFYNAAISTKSNIQKQIDALNTQIADQKAKKQDTTVFEGQLKNQKALLEGITPLDAWVPRIQTLFTAVSTTPGAFLDAVTWNAFGDDKDPLNISTSPRLTVVLSTQDGQVTQTFWLTGKKVYGRSAGELIYRVVKPDGQVVTVGYLTAMSSTGQTDFDAKETVMDDSHNLPKKAAAESSQNSQ